MKFIIILLIIVFSLFLYNIVANQNSLKEIALKNAKCESNIETAIIHKANIDYKPKISVIIPIYNTSEYLRECLDSAVNQTLKEIEIICVNDGSTDNSLDILKEYAEKDNRFTIISHKNQGLSCARNNALEISNGEYIVFLDSDDYLRDDALDIIYDNMKSKNLDMLSYGVTCFDNNTKKQIYRSYYEFEYLPKNFNFDTFNYKNAYPFLHKMIVTTCLTSYSRLFIKNNNIIFPPHLKFEDNLFFIKSITKAENCGIIKDKLFYRRIHNKSITQNWNKYYSDYLKITDLLLRYMKNFDHSLYIRYRNKYINSCIDQFISYSSEDQNKYLEELLYIIKKYNFNLKRLNYNSFSIIYGKFIEKKLYFKYPLYFTKLVYLNHK